MNQEVKIKKMDDHFLNQHVVLFLCVSETYLNIVAVETNEEDNFSKEMEE